MKWNWKGYLAICIVFILSFLATFLLPISGFAPGMRAGSVAVTLIAALYQIFRDEAAFEKEKNIKEQERLYTLSVSSHMAIVAFNKHAEFSEKYLDVMRKGLSKLSASGPSAEALNLAGALNSTRLDYAAWVTKDTRHALFPFEKALARIGINQTVSSNMPVGEKKSTLVEEAHQLYSKVMEYEQGSEDKDIGISNVVERIQELLGINELTILRREVIKQANKALDAKS